AASRGRRAGLAIDRFRRRVLTAGKIRDCNDWRIGIDQLTEPINSPVWHARRTATPEAGPMQTQLRADAFAPAPFDPEAMVAELTPSLAALEGAMAFGRDVAARVDRVYFVACGSPNRAMRGIQ